MSCGVVDAISKVNSSHAVGEGLTTRRGYGVIDCLLCVCGMLIAASALVLRTRRVVDDAPRVVKAAAAA